MNQNKIIYRAICLLFLLFTIYTILSWRSYGELDTRLIFALLLSVVILAYVTVERKKNYDIMAKQEKELQMYRLYIKPLEELVKEIRAKQHEFDNHMNAILNLHLSIHNYEELVKEQSKYIKEIYDDRGRQYTSLLKISDKVLAGFLYSKIVEIKNTVQVDVHIGANDILTKAPEHDLIEVIGTLIDNAAEACDERHNRIKIFLESRGDQISFEIWNRHEKVTMEEMSRFFEKGYSTKQNESNCSKPASAFGKERRGLGLYNARSLTRRCGGSLTVGMEKMNGDDYISFRAVL